MGSKSLLFGQKIKADILDELAVRPSSNFKVFQSSTATFERMAAPTSAGDSNMVAPYVTPVLSVFYWTFMSPYKISYNYEERKCIKQSGSVLRWIISGIAMFVVLANLFASLFAVSNTSNSALSAMSLIMYTGFGVFAATVFHFGWTKLDKVVDLLNEISNVAEYLGSFGVPIKCSTRDKVLIYFSLIVAITFAILYTLVTFNQNVLYKILMYSFKNGWQDVGETIYQNMTMRSARTLTTTFMAMNNSVIHIAKPALESAPRPIVITLGIIQHTIDFYDSFYWVFTFCGLFLWAIFFGNLFQMFVLKVKMCNNLGGDVLQDIRDFNRLSMILDTWNDIYGKTTFISALSGIMNGSLTAGDMVLRGSQGSALENLINLGALLPFLLVLMAGSRVNYLASEYGTLLKRQYTDQRSHQWKKPELNGEISHGLAIVLHQIQTNSVGIQGAGFFTISYSFIGTVVSVMATYAIVILQLGAVDNKNQ